MPFRGKGWSHSAQFPVVRVIPIEESVAPQGRVSDTWFIATDPWGIDASQPLPLVTAKGRLWAGADIGWGRPLTLPATPCPSATDWRSQGCPVGDGWQAPTGRPNPCEHRVSGG